MLLSTGVALLAFACTFASGEQCDAFCRVDQAVQPLLPGGYYYAMQSSTVLWRGQLSWQSGSTLETLANYALASKTRNPTAFNLVVQTFADAYRVTGGLPSDCDGFDDIGWWALAWLRGYDATGNPTYLAKATELFNFIAGNAWETGHCGGGVWWNSYTQYKNAITNELFLTQAMRVFDVTSNQTSLQWALSEWAWFKSCGMMNTVSGLINDGLGFASSNTSQCWDNNGTTWTYNQGVVLSGAGLLAQNEPTMATELLTYADSLASSVFHGLVNSDQILIELCEPNNCDNDQQIFKGIFVRHLFYLANNTLAIQTMPDRVKVYTSFISNWAQTLYVDAGVPVPKAGQLYGLSWSGSQKPTLTAATQSAAVDLLLAAAVLV
eukprot:TRINITY_DN10782_c0_g2_i1.p1 TRINITY_DN10782_c0_g2~~TRINITY_DN10782_c0_g2_i1.p1  ORF type:complete len:380 (+),score=-8.65 TRINITY_DN10782_c0_g2_i1:452-1591(+)